MHITHRHDPARIEALLRLELRGEVAAIVQVRRAVAQGLWRWWLQDELTFARLLERREQEQRYGDEDGE